MTPRTLILGLGNPILSDDRVGLLIADALRPHFRDDPSVDVCDGQVSGFDLIERLSGYRRVVIVDSIKTGSGRPGEIYRLGPEDLPATERLATCHEINLSTALALGRLTGAEMPEETTIFAVEVEDNRTIGQSCTPAVSGAVDQVVALVIEALGPH